MIMSRHIAFNKRSGEGQSIGLYRDIEIQVCGLLLPLAAQRSRILWEGLEGVRQVIKRAMLGSLVAGRAGLPCSGRSKHSHPD